MKKNLTRILAMALALLMCLSLLPASALAVDDFAALYAAANAAMAAAMGGGTPDAASGEMYLPADYAFASDGTDPNACLASDDGQHLFIEVIKPEYLCEAGDCSEEVPHLLYKSCAYCKQSAEWLYMAEMEAVQNEVMSMNDEDRAALMDDPVALADLEYRYNQYIFEVPDHLYVKVEGQAPTCTVGGVSDYEECAVCGEVRGYEELDPLGHNWGEYVTITEPTCTMNGSQKHVCERCGVEEYADIPALGHDWGEYVVVKEPTCTETGTTKRVCERCGAEDFGEIPAKGHSYGDFTVIKDATCTEDGSKEHTCTVCEYKETVVIPAAHTWGEYSVVTEPTCTEDGLKVRVCTVCEAEEEAAIPAAHMYEDGVCTVCGAAEPKDVKDETNAPVEEPKTEQPKTEEPKTDEITFEEPAGAQPVGAIVNDCRDMYASFGAYLSEQGVADANYVVASYTPVDANGQTLSAVPEGGVRFALPLPEGYNPETDILQVYTYSYDTYTWTSADFFLSDGQTTVSSGAYPFPPFAVCAAVAATEKEVPIDREASSAEAINEFLDLMDKQGISLADPDKIVAQHVTPLNEDGTEMTNEEVAARGGVTFEMPLPENYKEGDKLQIRHQNSETGEWETVTDYEIKDGKVILHFTHFSNVLIGVEGGEEDNPFSLDGTAAFRNNSGRISNVRICIDGTDTTVTEAMVGDKLVVKCNFVDPDLTKLKYQWYRLDASGSVTDENIGTGSTYTLTNTDCPNYINCSVCETGSENDAESAPNSVHVRMSVPFPINVRGLGTVKTTNLDKPNAETSAVEIKEYTHTALGDFAEANPPFPIGALTENTVTLTVEPAAGYVVRYVKEGSTTKIPASKESKTYSISSVNKSQANNQFWVYFDQYEVKIDPETAIQPSDQENKETVKQSFLAAYVKNDEPNAYYYVTPCWKGAPATPISETDLPTFGGFTFQLNMPTGITPDNYTDYDIHVYHYVKDSAKWETVPYETKIVEGAVKAEVQNFSRFSPFGIVAVPSVKMEFAPGDHASGSMEALTALTGENVTVPKHSFSNVETGYTFDCWEGSDNKTYNPGDSVTLNTDLTLTAKWKPGYTITFNDNDSDNPDTYGALVQGTMDPMYVDKDATVALTKNAYSLTNHAFKGWKTTPGAGDKEYDDEQSVTPTGNLDLYAVWQRTHVTVTYNAYGGSGTMSDQTAPVDSSLPLSANKYTAPTASQMFAGWSKTPDGNIDFTDGETIDVKDDLNNTDTVLYAVWRDKVTIHFRPDSASGTGSGTPYAQTVPSGVERALTANKFTPPSSAMAFAGWNDRQDGEGKDYVDQGEYSFTGETWLYAQWGPAITITYDKNSSDATGTMAAQKVAADESFKLSDLAFSNPAYEFKGWAKTSGGTPVYDDGETVIGGFPDDTTLYAVWDKKGFTGTVKLTGEISGSSSTAYAGEILTATVTGETVFTQFQYEWKRDDGKPLTAVEGHPDQYIPTVDDFGHNITCEVTATEATKNPKTKTSAPKEVGIDSTTKRIVNNGETEADYVVGLVDGMTYSINNGTKQAVTSAVMPVTQQGVYRFYKDDALVGIVEVENWYTVGYVNSTSSSTTTSSSGTSNAGSGTITAKATYDGTERSLTTSTTIKDTTTGEVVLEPYVSIGGYDHVWIVKQDSGVGFYLTVKPSSGSYGHVSLNSGSYDSSSAERTYRVDPVNTYAMYNIIFNRSSTSPKTGDESHLGLWSALCFTSLAGAGVLLNGERKRRKART